MFYTSITDLRRLFVCALLSLGVLTGCSGGGGGSDAESPTLSPSAATSPSDTQPANPAPTNPAPSNPPTTPTPPTAPSPPITPTPTPSITVSVAPAAAIITALQKQQFTSTVTNATNVAVTWRVDDIPNGNASVGTISADGLYSPPSSGGTHAIAAISVADPTKRGTASVQVNVVAPPAAVIVSVSPLSAAISTSQTQQFIAQVANSSNSSVTWAVDGIRNGNASVGVISTTGLYTPPASAGAHSITATSVADPTKSSSASVAVSVAPSPINVSVTPASASISTAQTQTFTAQVTNSSNIAVSWKVDGIANGNVTVGTITAGGVYSPPQNAGTHSISAISVADPTKSGSATVNVSIATPPTSVAVTPSTASISTIQSQQFTATVANSTDQTVTWMVDNVPGGNANVGMISATGLYVPSRVEAVHSVAAVSVADPTKRTSVTINVTRLSGVLTYHNDNARTGQTLQETTLKPSNVSSTTFGMRFALPVDGDVYAQPLYVANVPVGGSLHNVLFIATEHDTVYAFDADKLGAPLWQKSFIDPANGITTVPSADTNCGDIAPEIGITSTPVIDPFSGLLYVVAKTKENGVAKYRLHALDITTGADQSQGGVDIQASVNGSANPNNGAGKLLFSPQLENQRLSLLLSGNTIYFGTGSYCDLGDHHGWMLGYDAKTFALRSAYSTTPAGTEGGIWQAGGGAAADADGNLFLMTGDGTFDANVAGKNYGNSILKLTGDSLSVADYFTPYNEQVLEDNDGDLGSGGVLLLPDQTSGPQHLLVGAGKQGTVYVLDRDNMGRFQAGSDSQVFQSFSAGTCGAGSCGLFGTPAYFNNKVYTAGVNDGVKSYSITAGRLSLAARSSNAYKWPGATPAISANGSTNGIVWTIERNGAAGPSTLHAHSAADVTVELYNSNQVPQRDALGPAMKFAAPIIANGKVYVPSHGQVVVYGLLN